MKELIGAAIFIVGLLGAGSLALRAAHGKVRFEALRKIGQALPPLPCF